MEKKHIQYVINYALENNLYIAFDLSQSYSCTLRIFKNERELKDPKLKPASMRHLEGIYLFYVRSDFDSDILTKIFISSYKKGTVEVKEELLKEIDLFFDNKWSYKILEIVDALSENHKEASNIINTIPISTWNAKSVNYEKIDELLVKKNASEDDLLKFYVGFFKKRKNQLKSNIVGFEFKQFIFGKFSSEENLKKFINISNYVKEEFLGNDFSINDISGIDTVVLKINCKKLLEQMCNPKYFVSTLEQDLYTLSNGIRKHKNLEFVEFENQDRKNCVVELKFFHKNAITQKEVEDIVKDFLVFKKKEQEFEVNINSIESWLLKRDLENGLSPQKTEPKKKIGVKI